MAASRTSPQKAPFTANIPPSNGPVVCQGADPELFPVAYPGASPGASSGSRLLRSATKRSFLSCLRCRVLQRCFWRVGHPAGWLPAISSSPGTNKQVSMPCFSRVRSPSKDEMQDSPPKTSPGKPDRNGVPRVGLILDQRGHATSVKTRVKVKFLGLLWIVSFDETGRGRHLSPPPAIRACRSQDASPASLSLRPPTLHYTSRTIRPKSQPQFP